MKKLIFNLRKVFYLFAIAFAITACGGGGGDDGGGEWGSGGGGHWLMTKQTTYAVIGGKAGEETSSVLHVWFSYNYLNNKNYKEEYFTETANAPNTNSFSYNLYTRNGQTADLENITPAGTTKSTYLYDSESGLTKSSTSTSPTGVNTGASYVIEKISDGDGVKYKYYNSGSSTAYTVYKIQDGITLETKSYNADTLISTTTYSLSDNWVIRAKLGNYTLYSTSYPASSKSSFQTAEVLSDSNSALIIRVKTFNDGVLSSQIDTLYEKINPNVKINYNFNNTVYDAKNFYDSFNYFTHGHGGYPSSSDFIYGYYYDMGGVDGLTGITTFEPTYNQKKPDYIVIGEYKGNGGIVTIPKQIKGLAVKELDRCAFASCTKLTGIIIPDSVTIIRNDAFKNCINLTNVTIPDNVGGSLSSFSNCIKLTSITIPNGITYIDFSNCFNLTSVTFKKAGVSFHGSVFIDSANTASLLTAYNNGGIGTYTRQIGTSTWTKK